MNKNYILYNLLQKGWSIIAHLFLCLLMFQITRIGFYLFNYNTLESVTLGDFLRYAFYGMRFDLSAIAIIFGWMFVAWLLPIQWRFNKFFSIVFSIVITLCFCLEISDWKYFQYTHQRSGSDTLAMLARPSDFLQLLPNFITNYWYLFLIVLVFVFAIYKLSRSIFKWLDKSVITLKKNSIIRYILVVIVFVGLVIIGIRGGVQLVPIASRNAVLYAKNNHIPIVLNTTFNIATSMQNAQLVMLNYVDDVTMNTNIQPIKITESNTSFKNKNVVIIILESFSKEFTGLTPGKSYTPFLDSMMQYSLVFSNAYANANTSAKGIPAILAGIPSWRGEAFTTSNYSNNTINSFASLLQKEGYTSTFYHGATNGSMSFDVFAKNAGYDAYFGRKEYNNEKDYDGNWGIWDEPFLQRVVLDLNQKKEPFHAAIFNINSHHPYKIPKQYESFLKEDGLPIYTAIRYSDYALRNFFKSAAQQPWYQNSIFILVADHASPMASSDFYTYGLGKFQIPIIIFEPSHLESRVVDILTQQIDILPTVLQSILKYPYPFYAIGNNIFKEEPYVISQIGEETTMLHKDLQLLLANDSIIEAYLYPLDSLRANNIINSDLYKERIYESKIKYQSIIQRQVNDMIKDAMRFK